jgi:predicted nucleic acid-binding protein
MIAVDTNVFVYALDDDEPVKQAKARQLFQRLATSNDSVLLPWQVASELLSNLRRRESAGRITLAMLKLTFAISSPCFLW